MRHNQRTMLTPSEALQAAQYATDDTGQPVVQISVAAWETIQSALYGGEEEEDAVMLKLFLDFITAESLKSNSLQAYTQEMSTNARRLVDGVAIGNS